MVDPRIYRVAWVLVFVALVVFGFSLQNSPSGASTGLSPGTNFSTAYASAAQLADQFGAVAPGSVADDAEAAEIAHQLRGISGFSVATQSVGLRTARGEREVQTVTASRTGLGEGTVVVLANRDAVSPAGPAQATASATAASRHSTGAGATARSATIASTSASAVLVDLATGLTGATLNRSVMLVSTSGSVGAAGADALARSLAGGPVDAVVVLGDLAAARPRGPVVVPWSDRALLSPPTLVATADSALGSEAGIASGYPSFGSELAQLAFPFATGSQAPFTDAGDPAVGISLAGDRLPDGSEPVSAQRISAMGLAVQETIDALDAGPAMPGPSAYLTVSSQLLPLWAFRLLVLALIAPVAFSLIDALARARRRGHSVLSWIVWVFSAVAPFVVGYAVVKVAGLSHALSAPPGAVGTGVGFSVAGALTLAIALAATALAFVLLRPVGVQLASSIGWRRTPETPVIEGATVALSIVLCALTLIVWAFNPFAAALLVPALHLWLWLASPGVVVSRWRVAALLVAGLILPLLVAVYFMLSLGLAPWAFAWSVALGLAGGAVGLGTALSWCVSAGVLAGSIVLVLRASRAAEEEAVRVEDSVTSRGPLGYAGPGSLGGTSSALRR